MLTIPPIKQTPKADIADILQSYERILQTRTYHHLGYPYNLDFDYSLMHKLVDYSINNLGDPFIPSNYGVHSRPFEVAVIEWFAELWGLAPSDCWGYVTACGTEGNLHGIFLGVMVTADSHSDTVHTGMRERVVLIGSKACHYSVWKATRMYAVQPIQIATLENDEIDYTGLATTLKGLKATEKRVVMVVNVGSTVRGAVDDIERIVAAFHAAGYTPQHDYFLHLDGALFGMMMPFLPAIGKQKQQAYTFDNPVVCSISVSGHKFIGSPVPCGVTLTRKPFINKLSQNIAYINSRDATILGSRNGHASIFLWYAIVKKGLDGFASDAKQCMDNAEYLAARLKAASIQKVSLNALSCTVVFERPSSTEFISKWQLACEGDIAHVVVMPNVDVAKLDEFVADLIFSESI